jgi:FkbM family methyltransferase
MAERDPTFRPRSGARKYVVELGKKLITGKPWEPRAKRILYAITRNKNHLYDALSVEIMRRVLRHDSNALDIGAFEGGMLRHIVRFAPKGCHWAFEPIPERARQLRNEYPTPQVHVCALALSDTPGEGSFQCVVRAPALSGLRKRVDLATEEVIREIPVRVETLDRLIPEDFPIAFVKIDVEGGELGVLRGGRNTLRRTKPIIVFECGLGGADSYGTTPEQVFHTVTEELGLNLSLLPDWLAGRPALSSRDFGRQFRDSINYYFVAHPPSGR